MRNCQIIAVIMDRQGEMTTMDNQTQMSQMQAYANQLEIKR